MIQVENQKEPEVTIIQVSSLGGFSVYHLQTENGVVHVKRCYYGYKDGIMKSEDEGEYKPIIGDIQMMDI